MNGRFFIGVLSGAVLISGAFVVGSVMFPVEDGTTPVEVANAPEAPAATAPALEPSGAAEAVSEPEATLAETVPATDAEAAADPAGVTAPEPSPEPSPEPLPEPASVPLADVAPEEDPAKASSPPLAEAEAKPATLVQADTTAEPSATQGGKATAGTPEEPAAAVSESLPSVDAPTAELPAAAAADSVTSDATAPAVAADALAGAEPALSETVPAADPSPNSDPALQGTDKTPPVALAMAEPPAVEPSAAVPAAELTVEPATESVPAAPAPAEAGAQPQPPAVPDLPEADTTDAAKAPPPLPEAVEAAPAILPDPAPKAAADPVNEDAEVAPEAKAPDAPAGKPLPQEDGTLPSIDDPAGKTSDPDLAPEGAPALEELPKQDKAPEAELPEPDADPLPEPEGEAPADSTFTPTPQLGDDAGGVVIGRLPRIGDAPAAEPPAADAPAVTDMVPEVDSRPITAFAAKFENPDAKPLVALVLIDTGTADLDRAGLAALPFPVSFALDPLDPATPERAAIYRAAGREVVMLATGIAEGAQASDIEVAFQTMAQGLPEAVAVMDLAEPLFQDRRPLASMVVPVVGAQGRGLLTWDQGLNAADQVARREDVAAAVVFRDLASTGTDSEAVRRLLDRAVFKAGQDGRVAVAGEATPELVAALLEWTVEGRAATVALAPLTAVLTVD